MSDEKRLKVSRMTFYDIMATTMYVFGSSEEGKPIDIGEMLDYIHAQAQLIDRIRRDAREGKPV